MRSKNWASWKRSGAVTGRSPMMAARTMSAGKSATIAEYAVDWARLKRSCRAARTKVRCSRVGTWRRRLMGSLREMGDGSERASGLPPVEELRDRPDAHVAHVLELLVLLGEEELAVRVEHVEGGDSLLSGN